MPRLKYHPVTTKPDYEGFGQYPSYQEISVGFEGAAVDITCLIERSDADDDLFFFVFSTKSLLTIRPEDRAVLAELLAATTVEPLFSSVQMPLWPEDQLVITYKGVFDQTKDKLCLTAEIFYYAVTDYEMALLKVLKLTSPEERVQNYQRLIELIYGASLSAMH